MENLRIPSVKRKEQIKLFVNGKETVAFIGESVLASLIAAGYKNIKKSPVSGEKRGGFCGMGVCFECIAKIDGVPNIRTCMVLSRDGMEIEIEE